ncbi:THAP domain-containing protein [Phthorimaea operculella]|nr:THAP domain-containing protein [Phthorimaea operculella]
MHCIKDHELELKRELSCSRGDRGLLHNISPVIVPEILFKFYRFPTNQLVKSKWIAAVRLERQENDWMPSKYSKICSIHFNDEDIYVPTDKGIHRLNKHAVPVCTMIGGVIGPLISNRNETLVTMCQQKQPVVLNNFYFETINLISYSLDGMQCWWSTSARSKPDPDKLDKPGGAIFYGRDTLEDEGEEIEGPRPNDQIQPAVRRSQSRNRGRQDIRLRNER